MGDTSIEWATKVWNPVTGCTKVSPGCDHCYAARMATTRLRGRFGYPQDKPFRVTLRPERLEEPLHWKKPQRVFVCSMGDLFHRDVPDQFIAWVFSTMARCPQHTFMVLTKRPRRAAEWFEHVEAFKPGWEHVVWLDYGVGVTDVTWPLPNVWIGTSVEAPQLLPRLDSLARIPAKVRFVSCEPLLGPLDLRPYMKCHHGYPERCDDPVSALCCLDCSAPSRGVDWVIVGGESGPGARPMPVQWAMDIRDQCQEAGVPYFHKQNGEWLPYGLEHEMTNLERRWVAVGQGEVPMIRVGKKAAGRLLEGRTHEEVPNV